jgi:hypothetical protein
VVTASNTLQDPLSTSLKTSSNMPPLIISVIWGPQISFFSVWPHWSPEITVPCTETHCYFLFTALTKFHYTKFSM